MFPEGRGIEREVREANNSSPAATVHLGLLALSVVQETGWYQGAQRDKCSGRRSLCQSLCTLCQDTVSTSNCHFVHMKMHIESVSLM